MDSESGVVDSVSPAPALQVFVESFHKTIKYEYSQRNKF